jgi:hypothetical protein
MFKHKDSAMKARTFFQLVAGSLFLSSLTLSTVSNAADLEAVLSTAYPAQSSVSFVKHESVIQPSVDEHGAEKYMVLDFQIDNEILIEQQLQASIQSICNTVLTDHSLIEQLSNNGYDMISVSFDTNSQYDCL